MRARHIATSVVGSSLLFGFGSGALALPLGNAQEAAALQAEAPAYAFTDGEVDFTAIVALDDCSGSLVRFTTSRPEDKALVLTNGHCFEGGFIDAGQAVVARDSDRSFSLLKGDSTTLGTLTAEQVVYATMTGTDMTLYRLSTTFASLTATYGVQALTIADHHAAANDPVRIVSGYWRKIYACNIDNFVTELREADWTWKDSIRYTQPGCDTIGGTSGSPIVNANTREVVGVNNTGNESGERCTLNNPCEVDGSGNITYQKGASYGQELYWIYACLNSNNELDLARPDCRLTKPQ